MQNYNISGFYLLIIISVVIVIYYASKKFGFAVFFNKFKSNSAGTPFLNLYTTDFTHLAQIKKIDPVVGREDEVLKLSQVLSRRTKNNAILIGDPGVGKTAIVEGLSQRIVRGDVPKDLLNKRVLALDVATLMSGTKYRGEFEERAKKIIHEISSSNRTIILFIDEVHSVVQSQGTEGALNLSDILKPALARGDLQMIGATTFAEYEKYIKTDASLERRFQPIEIQEPNEEETLRILQGIKDKYREYHKVEFTDSSLETAVKLTKEVASDRKFPDKAIDAIDEAAAMVKVSHLHEVTTAILFQAAMAKHPEVANLWKQIQDTDKKIRLNQGDKIALTKERENLEAQIAKQGIVVVDSDDIEKVVSDWTHAK